MRRGISVLPSIDGRGYVQAQYGMSFAHQALRSGAMSLRHRRQVVTTGSRGCSTWEAVRRFRRLELDM